MFFGDESKLTLPYIVPPGARCCDNCSPELFPVETVRLTGGNHLKSGRRRLAKAADELIIEAKDVLQNLWNTIAQREFPDAYIITDPEHEAREAEKRERAFVALQALAVADLRQKLGVIFDACHEVSQTRPASKPGRPAERVCQIFMALPRKTAWPTYYQIIKYPMSIPKIKQFSHTKLVQSTTEYAALWHILFQNAQEFILEGSQIYEDAAFLQRVLDKTLAEQAELHGVPDNRIIPVNAPQSFEYRITILGHGFRRPHHNHPDLQDIYNSADIALLDSSDKFDVE
ncbi:hypothetical protein B0H13DRAFT_2359671 [Mycena leptocephala]|nr:hypothetical protein B0H13DRAFT_2359671 [Mycena leptocephala]